MTLFHTEWDRDNLTRTPPRSFSEMEEAMRNCHQTAGQSVLAHGESVCDHFFSLLDHLKGTVDLAGEVWRLPDWLDTYRAKLLDNLHPEGRLRLYTTYHDCGKPYCRQIDKVTGEQRFPDHAKVSRYIWACVGGNDIVGHLIGEDMVIHLASAEDIDFKVQNEWSCEDSVTLLLAALAEIHSNAKMFGGVGSISFKMKFKQVEKRGRRICKFWFDNT
jgi:hypothetical protein